MKMREERDQQTDVVKAGSGAGLWRLVFLVAVAMAVVVSVAVLRSTEAQAIDQSKCLTCHSNPSLSKTGPDGKKISLYVSEEHANTSAHRYIDCTTCHTTNPHSVNTPLTKLSLAEKCGTCHQYEYQQHLQSIHGQELAKGNPDVATCVDCHSSDGNPHNVTRVLEYNAPTYKKNIAETCAKCHANEALMANYGIVEKVYESYMRTFHGKAIQLGTYEMTQLDEATCTNCHGVHDIESTTAADSPVAGVDNLAKTCEQCHPGAGVQFAKSFLGHKEASVQDSPVVFYAEKFFFILTTSVLGLGIFLVGSATIRWGIGRWRE